MNRRLNGPILLLVAISWPASAWISSVGPQARSQSNGLQATSTSDLRGRKNEKYAEDSVVKRLKRAAARAAAAKKEAAPVTTPESSPSTSSAAPPKQLASLRQLTQAIDQQLAQSRTRSHKTALQRPPLDDSMSSIIGHNIGQRAEPRQRHVALLLAKPLHDDQVSKEGAGRIRLLVKTMLDGYQPDLIGFIGGVTGDNRLADADASYLFFQHLSSAVKLTRRVPIHLERSLVDQNAIEHVVGAMQTLCLPGWWEDLHRANDLEHGVDETKTRRHRMQVHFSLFSSEYQLCQLNDIHTRSPNQSVLRALGTIGSRIDTTWSYHYTTTATAYGDPLRAFAAKTYKTAQDLVPVLYNLRGVTESREFFQRDNYRVLVGARRSLVADMESMYQRQPSLDAVHQVLNDKPLDVVLEAALLSLGRCLDLVRPAGLLTGSVSEGDFKRALSSLQQAYYLLDRACDPDEPLDPDEWGRLEPKGSVRQ